MKNRTRIIIVLGAAIIATGVYLATRQVDEQAATNPLLANIQTAEVTRTTLSNSVESSGSVIANATVQLSFGASGSVSDVYVTAGDQVKQGDVLATLDTTDLQLAVTQAEQAYLIQQLTYSDTIEPDAGDLVVAQAQYNSALASYNAAQRDYAHLDDREAVQCSQLTSAQQSLDRAQTAYDRLANDNQAKDYIGPWGRFKPIVDALTNAQTAYEQALASCNITRLNLNDSALRSAQTQLQNAKANVDSLVTPSSETQIQAQARLEQARLSLEEAQQNLADANIIAPFDGVVTALNIAAGGASGSAAAITLVDVSQLHVDVLVDETDIAMVELSQKVELTLDALEDIALTGEVARIDPAGTVIQGVVNYNVRVDLDPIDAPVRLDMTANASILGETRENVLAVPTTAIQEPGQDGFAGLRGQGGFGGQGGQGGFGGQGRQGSFVLVIENGQMRPVQVTVGLTAGDMTEVSGDLQEGAQVVVGFTTSAAGGAGFFGGRPGGGPGFFGGPPP